MTMTPIPRKVEALVVCDGCGATQDIVPGLETMPPPWRLVQVPGWVGKHHACCDGCERAILAMHQDDPATIVPKEEWDEDTNPD